MNAAQSVSETGIGRRPCILRICGTEFCRARGSERLVAYAERLLGVKMGGTTADNCFTLQPGFCFGYCGQAPVVTLDGEVCVRASTEFFDQLIAGRQAPAGEAS